MAEKIYAGPAPQFYRDGFSWIVARGEDGGMLRSQSVESHLLFAILHELRQQSDGPLPDRESFWLIERKVSPPQYITNGNDLSSDPLRARRWTSERAAHDHWRLMTAWRDECFVCEHLFINKQ